MSQTDPGSLEHLTPISTETAPIVENPESSEVPVAKPRTPRRLSKSRLALQGPLLILAIAGIGFAGSFAMEKRDVWEEVLLGKKPKLASAGSGGHCTAMAGNSSGGCASQAKAGGCCARKVKGVVATAGCNSASKETSPSDETATSDEPAISEDSTSDEEGVSSASDDSANEPANGETAAGKDTAADTEATESNSAGESETQTADEVPSATEPAQSE